MNIFSSALYIGYRVFGERGAVILAYHSIGQSDSPWTVTPEEFARQMQWLADNKMNVVSLDEVALYRKAGAIPPHTVAITFDDGYRDNYTVALPILAQHNFPATLFLTTGTVGGTRILPSGESLEMLSQDEVRALVSSRLFIIGAHSVTHPKFTKIDAQALAREIRDSRAYIEHVFNLSCRHLAYPHGRHSMLAYEAARRAGIEYAYTTEQGVVTPRNTDYTLPRSVIGRATTLREFKAITHSGAVSLGRLRRTLGI